MSTMLRLILLFILAAMSYQSWGKMMAIDVGVYDNDGSQNAYHAKNQESLTYDEFFLIPASTKATTSKILQEKTQTGSFFALQGDFIATKSASKEITKSSRKRVKRLIKNLSDNSRQNNGLSQEKTDQLRRIVEKAGGKLRNDGATGVKGSSAGKPHVQTEGLGKSIDSRHIWTQGGVQ